ncbi:lipocalin-like domain-containing protein [Massilia sp. LXY-6]|uniref:lipocalin-like domain-containing protein n=1 Tax=Massilia sp. LXY-6 TaxID=3379823 RepID=UPI003EDECF0A
MKPSSKPPVHAAMLCFLVAGTFSNAAFAQQKSLKEQIVGTWTYVSVDNIRPDGSRVPLFGPAPQGRVMFDRNGNYVLMTSRSGQPKFASGNRNQGTNDEYKAVAQGSIAHFGRYEVNEADKTLTFHIEASTFPNWNGIEQKRPFSINRDELKWVTPAASSGGSAEVVLKRTH